MQKNRFVELLSLFLFKRLIYFLQINFLYITVIIIVYLLIPNKTNQIRKDLLFYIALFAIAILFLFSDYQTENKPIIS